MGNKQFICIIALVGLASGCYKETIVSQNQIFVSMSGNHASISADGVSKQMINVELNSETTDTNNSITFTTTQGLFDIVSKNTITVTAQNVTQSDGIHKIATVYLVSSNDEGTAYVTASIKNYTQIDTIIFSRAYPDQIHLNVDKLNYQFSNTGEVTVTVEINRNIGTGIPSIGQTINLSAVDSTQKSIGSFRNLSVVMDATGSCVNYFSLPPTDSTYIGKIQLKASIQNDPTGRVISDSTTINVYK